MRIPFLCALATILCASGAFHSLQAEKPPYRILYSNDTTHITSCPSPYKPKRSDPFTEDMLRASINEAAGADIAQMLQPGLGWVPWWKSQVVPIEGHVKWLQSVGRSPNTFEKFVLGGGDLIAIFIDQCRKTNQPAIVSVRVNDTHHVSRGSRAKTPEAQVELMKEFQFFADNLQRRVGPGIVEDPKKQHALDWGDPVVREHKFRIIEEICKNYDIDGLELDLMRHWVFFNPKRTTAKERAEIMNHFVARIRKALDAYAPAGKRRWLIVRIPGYLDTHAGIGIDLKGLAESGVDAFNLSSHYFSDLQMQISKVREIVGPDKGVYAEMQFVNAVGNQFKSGWAMRRTTPVQYYTNAYLAYSLGADGVSLFNFPYYRGTYAKNDVPGSSTEPPFEILKHLGDIQWLAKQPQQYVLGYIWDAPKHKGRPLRALTGIGKTQKMRLQMAPPADGWKSDGRLRIQSRDSLAEDGFEVIFNGVKLKSTPDVSEPFANPYDVAIGAPEDYRAWIIPRSLLKRGENLIELTQTKGKPHQLFYLDVSIDNPPLPSREK